MEDTRKEMQPEEESEETREAQDVQETQEPRETEETQTVPEDAVPAEESAQDDILPDFTDEELLAGISDDEDLPEVTLEEVMAEFFGDDAVSEPMPEVVLDTVVRTEDPETQQEAETEARAMEQTEAEAEARDEEPSEAAERPAPEDPAFDDPETIHDPKEPLVYCNYSNDYGKAQDEPEESEETEEEDPQKIRDDRTITGLLITSAVLLSGIVGVMVYWLNVFLK